MAPYTYFKGHVFPRLSTLLWGVSWEACPHRWRVWWWWVRPPWQLGLETRDGGPPLQNLSQGPLLSVTVCGGRWPPCHRTSIYLYLGCVIWDREKSGGRGTGDQPPLTECFQTQRASARTHRARPSLGTSAPARIHISTPAKLKLPFPLTLTYLAAPTWDEDFPWKSFFTSSLLSKVIWFQHLSFFYHMVGNILLSMSASLQNWKLWEERNDVYFLHQCCPSVMHSTWQSGHLRNNQLGTYWWSSA